MPRANKRMVSALCYVSRSLGSAKRVANCNTIRRDATTCVASPMTDACSASYDKGRPRHVYISDVPCSTLSVQTSVIMSCRRCLWQRFDRPVLRVAVDNAR